MKAIIIAAGFGSRLWPITQQVPKTLLPFGESTILGNILGNFGAIGVREFALVVGFKEDLIRDYLSQHDNFGYTIDFVSNPEYERGNGLSVFAAREHLCSDAPNFLSMSDHLVHPNALRSFRDVQSSSSLLLTDSNIDEVHDIDDATKVLQDANKILKIGKELKEYNALDTGIFRVTSEFMHALEEAIQAGEESISHGVRRLIEAGKFQSAPFPDDAAWVDVDTPDALLFAKKNQHRYLEANPSADPSPEAVR